MESGATWQSGGEIAPKRIAPTGPERAREGYPATWTCVRSRCPRSRSLRKTVFPPSASKTVAGRETGELTSLLYRDLRRIAGAQLRRLPKGATLQATALVHEAYLRLANDDASAWSGRNHFLGAAARAMRRIVVEHARRRSTQKRGGDARRDGDLESVPIELGAPVEDLLALDEALDTLEKMNARQAMIVMLRYFVGLPDPDIAEVVGVSPRTVRRDWHIARLRLAQLIAGEDAQ